MVQRLAGLYVHDARGRLLHACAGAWRETPGALEAQGRDGEAPRFHLVRTRWGNLWRLRADVPRDTAIRLATLAGREPLLEAESGPLEREVFIERALEADAPIAASDVLSLYGFPKATPPEAEAARLGLEVRSLRASEPIALPEGLAAWGVELESVARADGLGAWRSGELVAVCFSRTGANAPVREAWVFTAPAHRRQRIASSLLVAWADTVREQGGTPLFGPRRDDRPARVLAHGIGLEPLGEDRSWF